MRRVTITIPDETIAAVERQVDAGSAPSVSAYLSGLAAQATREADLLALLDELDANLGKPGKKDVAWANRLLDRAR